MNILAIGAHYDDVEMGCSGTLMKHVAAGDNVTILVASKSEYRNPQGELIRSAENAAQEGAAAAKIMGVDLTLLGFEALQVPNDDELGSAIRFHVEELAIDTVYCHWIHDVHRDHQHVANASIMSARHVPRVLMYRSNYYDSYEPFRGNFYSDISDYMERKIEVIAAHKSELARVRNKWIDFISRQNANDGQKIGVAHAERFETIRYVF